MPPHAAQGTWTCQACGLIGFWIIVKHCIQCHASRQCTGPPKRRPKGRGKGNGKGKGKGNNTFSAAVGASRWKDGPSATIATPRNPFVTAGEQVLAAENEKLKIESAGYKCNEKQAAAAEATANIVQIVQYGGKDCTLSQLHTIDRAVECVPPDHSTKNEVHSLIRKLQKQRGNATDLEERCAHLETIINGLMSKMDNAKAKYSTLDEERGAIYQKTTQAQEDIDSTQQKIDEVVDDKKEAELRRNQNLQHGCSDASEGLNNDIKEHIRVHYPRLHTMAEENKWGLPQQMFRKHEQELHAHLTHHTAVSNVLQHQPADGFTPHQKNIIQEQKNLLSEQHASATRRLGVGIRENANT